VEDEWIVRVQGQEYGPVDLAELREWKAEGRLIRENEVRTSDSEQWIRAGELPELFADEVPVESPPVFAAPATISTILVRTWGLYVRGFAQFLALSALVFVPSVCTQLSGAAVGASSEVALDMRTALASLFNLLMMITSLIAWPVYLAGIQIMASQLLEGRKATMGETVARALKLWPRMAALCILVYGAFILLTVFAFAILLLVAAGASSPILVPIALGLLFLQIWMFGRVFAITLFWQQTAALEDASGADAVRRSSALAYGRGDLRRFRRPLWRGAFLASIWCVLATALAVGPEWSMITEYFNAVTTLQDPQAILQAMTAHSNATAMRIGPLVLGVIQAILRPLLGIAFVVLYYDLQARAKNSGDSAVSSD
jgi:hypothetical protein